MTIQESFGVLADVVGLCNQARVPIRSAFAFDCDSVDVIVDADRYDEIVELIFDGEGVPWEWKDEEDGNYYRRHDGRIKNVRLAITTFLRTEGDAE